MTGPYKRFPAPAVTDILKDVLTSYLQEEKYEVEWSQKMTKTICEVNKTEKLTHATPFEYLGISILSVSFSGFAPPR